MSLESGRVAEPDQAGRTASFGGPEAGVLYDANDPTLTVKSSLLLKNVDIFSKYQLLQALNSVLSHVRANDDSGSFLPILLDQNLICPNYSQ